MPVSKTHVEERPISRVVRPNDRGLRGRNVRLIDAENQQLGIVPVDKAIELASQSGYDLVAVAEKADPPVCRLMNYGKYVYEKKKREREQRKKQNTNKVKEVKFHANIDPHDYKIKLNHILDFLEKGHRVRVSLYFRGREMAHRDIGRELIEKISEDIGDHGTVESRPRMQGRILSMQVAPGH